MFRVPRVARLVTTLAALGAAGIGARVHAVDPRGYAPAPTAGAILGLGTTWVGPTLAPFVGLDASYARNELVVTGPDARPLLHERLVTTLVAGLALARPLELALALPFALVDADGGAASGLGDLRVAGKLAIVRPEATGLGLALTAALALPTGAAPYTSDGGVGFDGALVLDWSGRGGIAAGLTVGYRHRPAETVGGLVLGDEVRWGLATELPLDALGARGVPLALLGEVEGAVGVEDPSLRQERPVEARLGLRARVGAWSFTVASATGISTGYGAPDHRVVARIGFGPSAAAARSEEVIVHREDDAVFASDGAPPIAGPIDDPDADVDRVPKGLDGCPDEPEDLDGFEDGDGCPDPDNDSDGVLDAADRCASEKETVNGFRDDDGCADAAPVDPAHPIGPDGANDPRHPGAAHAGPAIQSTGLITLPAPIEFNPGSDVLQSAADAVLAQLATFVLAHPEVRRIRIEGHTDDRGDEEFNVDLSERRAARVRAALVKRGVAGDRLLPKGFGPTRPLAPNTSDKARKQNRRVELRIIDPAPTATPLPADGGAR